MWRNPYNQVIAALSSRQRDVQSEGTSLGFLQRALDQRRGEGHELSGVVASEMGGVCASGRHNDIFNVELTRGLSTRELRPSESYSRCGHLPTGTMTYP